MPLKETKTKEYKLPLKEFAEQYGLNADTITQVSYYGLKCDRDEETKEPHITIEAELE